MAVEFKKSKPAGVSGQNQGPAAVSLRPSDAQQGGLVDDVDVEIKQARFIEWDYNGTINTPVLGMELTLLDTESKEYVQVFSAGDLKRLQPSDDGKRAIAVGGATGLAASSNCVAFLASLIDAGFPEDKFGDGDITVMEGANVHVLRKAQAARKGLANANANGRENTVLLVTKINRLPWERAGKASTVRPTGTKAATTTQAASTSSVASNGAVDVDDLAGEVLVAMLEGNGGEVAKASVSAKSFKIVSKDPYKAHRAEILAKLTNDDWLEAAGEQYGFGYDGKSISAA